MKSLALFLSLCVLLTFVSSLETQEESLLERGQNCKNPCEGCQKTIYSLKFIKQIPLLCYRRNCP